MREILFRGKRVDNGEWVMGYMLMSEWNNSVYIVTQDECNYNAGGSYFDGCIEEVIPETVGQYTGLTDKDGKKIFEGDICRFREWSKGDMCWIGKVHYEHQQFVISGNPNKECESEFLLVLSRFIPENIEIIGNIHDNPELLKGEADER